MSRQSRSRPYRARQPRDPINQTWSDMTAVQWIIHGHTTPPHVPCATLPVAQLVRPLLVWLALSVVATEPSEGPLSVCLSVCLFVTQLRPTAFTDFYRIRCEGTLQKSGTSYTTGILFHCCFQKGYRVFLNRECYFRLLCYYPTSKQFGFIKIETLFIGGRVLNLEYLQFCVSLSWMVTVNLEIEGAHYFACEKHRYPLQTTSPCYASDKEKTN